MPEAFLSSFSKSQQPLTVEEVALIIRKQPRTVRKYARIGIIPGAFQHYGKRGHWRFKRKVFQTWWEQQGAL